MKNPNVRKEFLLTPKQAKLITKAAKKYKKTESDIVRLVIDGDFIANKAYREALFSKKTV